MDEDVSRPLSEVPAEAEDRLDVGGLRRGLALQGLQAVVEVQRCPPVRRPCPEGLGLRRGVGLGSKNPGMTSLTDCIASDMASVPSLHRTLGTPGTVYPVKALIGVVADADVFDELPAERHDAGKERSACSLPSLMHCHRCLPDVLDAHAAPQARPQTEV